jgi:hypothetical protein
MKPSDASTTISSGERPCGVACPLLSVSHRTPAFMTWTRGSVAWRLSSACRSLKGSTAFEVDADRFLVVVVRAIAMSLSGNGVVTEF